MIKKSILKKTRKPGQFNMQQPVKEVVRALDELSPDAFRMLAYMYTKSDNWIFNNVDFQKALGIAESTVKKKLKELRDNNYYYECKGKVIIYFIGLNAVKDYKGTL